MLRKAVGLFLFMILLGFLNPVQADKYTGMWEIVMSINMANLPIQIPPQTIKQCLSQENMVPQTQSEQGCVVTSKGLRGNRVEWKLKCQTAQGPATGSGYMVFRGDTMSGQTVINIQVNGDKVATTTNLRGRRIGDC